MKFLIDAQLPPSLVQWLRSVGCEAEHVEEMALRNAEDRAIRDHAVSNGFVLLTKDRDFVPAAESTATDLQVVWIRTGNISNRVLFQRLAADWTRVLAHLETGVRIVELR
ncbi:MAG TPA: DUF5615 family PIN-like protein [Rhizomicrobium sp.]